MSIFQSPFCHIFIGCYLKIDKMLILLSMYVLIIFHFCKRILFSLQNKIFWAKKVVRIWFDVEQNLEIISKCVFRNLTYHFIFLKRNRISDQILHVSDEFKFRDVHILFLFFWRHVLYVYSVRTLKSAFT